MTGKKSSKMENNDRARRKNKSEKKKDMSEQRIKS
jgi:hypothetical protein